MEDLIKVIITIKKNDLPKFIDKFQVEEYTVNNKKQEVTINMTELFDTAVKQYAEETSKEVTDSPAVSSDSPF